MPPELPQAGSDHDWLRHARSDLALSRMRKTKTLIYEHLCFHAQQAVEKSLKSVLVHCGVRVPRSHDLAFLVGMLPCTIRIPPALVDMPILTKYAVQQRYPGENPPVTLKHRRHAVQLAEDAVAWATQIVGIK
jgi:HEPN domain-containing protein